VLWHAGADSEGSGRRNEGVGLFAPRRSALEGYGIQVPVLREVAGGTRVWTSLRQGMKAQAVESWQGGKLTKSSRPRHILPTFDAHLHTNNRAQPQRTLPLPQPRAPATPPTAS